MNNNILLLIQAAIAEALLKWRDLASGYPQKIADLEAEKAGLLTKSAEQVAKIAELEVALAAALANDAADAATIEEQKQRAGEAEAAADRAKTEADQAKADAAAKAQEIEDLKAKLGESAETVKAAESLQDAIGQLIEGL